MKAPDRIYIETNTCEAFSSKWTTIPFKDFENTEYIRKDALLEWLGYTKKLWQQTSSSQAALQTLDMVIGHINTM